MTIALVILAAFFKSVADTLQHHFYSSVFRRWESSPFWNPLHARNDAVKRIAGFPLDAWHIANSLMIWSFTAAIVFNDLHLAWYWQMKLIGVVFILVFNLFYNKLFR